jgi:hypothetical protein
VEFVYDDVFTICTHSGWFCIFDITHRGLDAPKPSYSVDLLHRIPFWYSDRSHIQWTPGVSHMVTLSGTSYSRLLIPHDREKNPSTFSLGWHDVFSGYPSFKLGISTSLGYDNVVVCYWVARHDIHANADPGAPLTAWLISGGVHLHSPDYVFGFSEDIGRLVLSENGWWRTLTVIDLVPQPPYNCN